MELLLLLENYLTSNQDLPLDSELVVYADIMKPLPGRTLAGNPIQACPNWDTSDFGKSLSRFLIIMPDYVGELNSCCLLVAVVAGVVLQLEHKERIRLKSTTNRAVTLAWKRIRDMHSKSKSKSEKSRRHLLELVKRYCTIVRRRPESFKNLSLEEVEEVAKLFKVNIVIYSPFGSFNLLKKMPESFDFANPIVSILLFGKSERSHCALITDESKFFSHRGRFRCHYCDKSFHSTYFPFHKCPLRCRKCLRMSQECFGMPEACREEGAEGGFDLNCKCGFLFRTRDCLLSHKRWCKRLKLEKCSDCGSMYRKSKKPHICNSTYCFTCRCYRSAEKSHTCYMVPPGDQKHYTLLGFWDTETTQKEKGFHSVNAVGFSFERREKRGSFVSYCAYAESMAHDMDMVELADNFEFCYWSADRQAPPPPVKPVPKRGRRSHFRKVVLLNGNAELEGEEEREEEVAASELGGNFVLSEAQVADEGEEDEEEEEETMSRLGESERGDPLGWYRSGEPAMADLSIDQESALAKFLDRILCTEMADYTWIAHNSARW